MSPRIHIETAGCAFNASDSEAMAGILRRAGHEIVHEPSDAEVLILNTCTVKDKTLRNFRRRLRRLGAPGPSLKPPSVILAGCIPKAQPEADFLRNFPMLGPDAIARVDEVVAETLRGGTPSVLDAPPGGRNRLPVLRRNPAVEILPIARGCRSACSFCQTRLARGRLVSFPQSDILDQARRALDDGVKIIWVTAQDTGAYGHDTGSSLDKLLGELLALPGDFMLRLGMSSPQWIAERLPALLDILEHPKMFKFLHVPLQSGSDSVLEHMKRDGSVAQFRTIHGAFRARMPRGAFVTDMIVGYPTETDADFARSMKLVEELELGLVNISKFSPRPGTAAARLPILPEAWVKERAAVMLEAIRAVTGRRLSGEVGREMDLLIEQPGCKGVRVARNENYLPVHVNTEEAPGRRIRATITGWREFHAVGGLSAPGPNRP